MEAGFLNSTSPARSVERTKNVCATQGNCTDQVSIISSWETHVPKRSCTLVGSVLGLGSDVITTNVALQEMSLRNHATLSDVIDILIVSTVAITTGSRYRKDV